MEIYVTLLLNISYQAAMIVCIILLVRQVFSWMRVPKQFSFLLWLIPFLRMLIPWTIESGFSLLPTQALGKLVHRFFVKLEPETGDIIAQTISHVQIPDTSVISPVPGGEPSVVPETMPIESSDKIWSWFFLLGMIWLAGFLGLMIYSLVSYWHMKRKLACSIQKEENIYFADHITTPFVLGIWKPRIYLPSDIQTQELTYVIAHEQIHIRKKDPFIKILAFLITSIHWFNPLAWVAFVNMSKDMELSCDEAVMKQMGEDCRQAYASALLEFTAGRGIFSGIPLAFGEKNTKRRIQNIMKYKKPLTITCVFAVLALLVLGIGLLTSPKPDPVPDSPTNQVQAEENRKQNIEADQREKELENLAEDEKVLEEQINQREKELESLTEEKKLLEEQIAQKGRELETLTEEKKDSEEQIAQTEKELESLTEEKKVLEEQIAQIEKELESLMEQKKVLEGATDQKIEELNGLQALNSGLYAMIMEEDGLTVTGGTIQIYNCSDEEITFGDDYSLWRLEQDQWAAVPYVPENWGFHQPAYSVEGGKMRTQELDWEWLYGALPTGTYLLKKPIQIPTETGGYETIELGVHFTL